MSKKVQKPLEKDLNVDVLIIGGGITGLSTAYNLMKKNLKVALVEKNQLFSGVTSRTTGKITYLQEDIYSKLKLYFNEEVSKKYYNSQIDAIKLLIDTINKNKIKSDLEKVESYVFTNNKIKKLKKEKELLEIFNVILESNKLPEKLNYKSSISVSDTYVFNPIKYLNSIKDICLNNKIQIYENTNILKIEKIDNGYYSYTKNNRIKSKYVVLALHFPYFLFPFLTPLKVTSEKSYIRAFKVNKNYKYSAINIEKPTKSIRFYDDKNFIYKIELTGSHNIGVKNNDKLNFNTFNSNKKAEFLWSNIDIITNDKLPLIGKINDNLLIGTGYNTWGMTNATLAGKIISDIILKKSNKYIELFDPKRNVNIGKIINFPISLGSNIYSFVNSKINVNKDWYNSNIKFKKINNKKIGIYTDSNNKEHTVYITCPHLKCNLIFNEIELTWDCPCHGSRFDIDGNCIKGPSNYNINFQEKNN